MVTLGVMDVNILETSTDGSLLTFLSLTTPHDMVCPFLFLIRISTNSPSGESHSSLTEATIHFIRRLEYDS